MPYGITVYRKYNVGMMITKGKQRKEEYASAGNSYSAYQISPPCSLWVPGLENVEFTVFPYEKTENTAQKTYTKWFDYDKMKKGFEIRTRKAGDYIIVDDEGHHKKLKQVFTGDKIPAQQRAGLWLIAHESLVHAIIGYRSGCGALVTPQTGKVLKITFYGGKQNGFFKKI